MIVKPFLQQPPSIVSLVQSQRPSTAFPPADNPTETLVLRPPQAWEVY